VQAFPLTSKYTNQSNVAISEVITVPMPSTDNAKQSLTTRLFLSKIFADISQELAQTHPIKHEPSITSPKIHINQTSPFRK
jgi:hypothetical protein